MVYSSILDYENLNLTHTHSPPSTILSTLLVKAVNSVSMVCSPLNEETIHLATVVWRTVHDVLEVK